jgi:DNA-directed RNA polymerase specialized sigma24 family protein
MTDSNPSAAGPLGHIAEAFVAAFQQGQRSSVGEVAEAGPTAWPVLWARCWRRICTWQLPPLWAARDWYEEAHAQGALADARARRDFDPARGVPLEAFRYRRVVDAVRARYRQEWSYGRRARPELASPDRPDPARPGPDPDTLAWIASSVATLADPDRGLIHQLFWDGRGEDDLAREWGVSQQAVSKRKQRILNQLRCRVGMP